MKEKHIDCIKCGRPMKLCGFTTIGGKKFDVWRCTKCGLTIDGNQLEEMSINKP